MKFLPYLERLTQLQMELKESNSGKLTQIENELSKVGAQTLIEYKKYSSALESFYNYILKAGYIPSVFSKKAEILCDYVSSLSETFEISYENLTGFLFENFFVSTDEAFEYIANNPTESLEKLKKTKIKMSKSFDYSMTENNEKIIENILEITDGTNIFKRANLTEKKTINDTITKLTKLGILRYFKGTNKYEIVDRQTLERYLFFSPI